MDLELWEMIWRKVLVHLSLVPSLSLLSLIVIPRTILFGVKL